MLTNRVEDAYVLFLGKTENTRVTSRRRFRPTEEVQISRHKVTTISRTFVHFTRTAFMTFKTHNLFTRLAKLHFPRRNLVSTDFTLQLLLLLPLSRYEMEDNVCNYAPKYETTRFFRLPRVSRKIDIQNGATSGNKYTHCSIDCNSLPSVCLVDPASSYNCVPSRHGIRSN